jgi:hypothetical protein
MKGKKKNYVEMYFHHMIRNVTTYDKFKIDSEKILFKAQGTKRYNFLENPIVKKSSYFFKLISFALLVQKM